MDSDFDREIVDALVEARRILASDNIALSASKPLFDHITPSGPVRPPWLVTVEHNGASTTAILDSGGIVPNDSKRDEALAFCGCVIAIDPANIHELMPRLRRQVQNEKVRP